MINNSRTPHDWRVPFATFSAAFVVSLFLTSYSQADPTLVVDVDTGAMSVYVGNDGLSLPKSSVGCSWDANDPCPTSLTAGDWPAMDSFSITSASDSLVGNVGGPDILDMLFYSNADAYSELTFGTPPTHSDGTVLPLTAKYDTGVDARDLHFASDLSGGTTQWNTIYIGVPEPSSVLLAAIGLAILRLRRRR